MKHFFYIDSLHVRHKIEYSNQAYNSVMELICDLAIEDWGDCKGRAWCGTCHVKVNKVDDINSLDTQELKCINGLYDKSQNSRLGCHIELTDSLHDLELTYVGVD